MNMRTAGAVVASGRRGFASPIYLPVSCTLVRSRPEPGPCPCHSLPHVQKVAPWFGGVVARSSLFEEGVALRRRCSRQLTVHQLVECFARESRERHRPSRPVQPSFARQEGLALGTGARRDAPRERLQCRRLERRCEIRARLPANRGELLLRQLGRAIAANSCRTGSGIAPSGPAPVTHRPRPGITFRRVSCRRSTRVVRHWRHRNNPKCSNESCPNRR